MVLAGDCWKVEVLPALGGATIPTKVESLASACRTSSGSHEGLNPTLLDLRDCALRNQRNEEKKSRYRREREFLAKSLRRNEFRDICGSLFKARSARGLTNRVVDDQI